MLQWLSSFLTNRRQRVVLRNGQSSWRWVKSGVPQGSILGPIMFLVYVNDMPDDIACTAKMFADDTKVYNTIRVFEDCCKLQDDLNNLSLWSRKWLLSFNESKCVVVKLKMAFHYMYTLNGHVLEQVKSQKDLGVTISDNLKSSDHIMGMVKKANQKIGMIRRCFSSLTKDKVLVLYRSIVRPILEYGSPVWNPHLRKDVNLIESTQRRCLRLCNENIVLSSLEMRGHFTDLYEVYKYLNNLYKNGMTDMFSISPNQLRGHTAKLVKPFRHSTVRRKFFAERVINSWNTLPKSVVAAPSLQSFKERLRGLLFS